MASNLVYSFYSLPYRTAFWKISKIPIFAIFPLYPPHKLIFSRFHTVFPSMQLLLWYAPSWGHSTRVPIRNFITTLASPKKTPKNIVFFFSKKTFPANLCHFTCSDSVQTWHACCDIPQVYFSPFLEYLPPPPPNFFFKFSPETMSL